MKTLRAIRNLLIAAYFIGFMISALVFNWQYSKSSSFVEWLFLGELVPTAKAIIWPYYIIGGGIAREAAPPVTSQGPLWESDCQEPLPVFTLGEDSNPTEEQEAAFCACIWRNLGGWEREVSEKIARGKDSEISWLHRRAFPSRFGSAIEKCGGMKL